MSEPMFLLTKPPHYEYGIYMKHQVEDSYLQGAKDQLKRVFDELCKYRIYYEEEDGTISKMPLILPPKVWLSLSDEAKR